ncbi:MAG: hypothetical protein OXN89_01780 [Bryobacterales bacterium]|nr:hypothetical protein [Bryobacterales bacterium]
MKSILDDAGIGESRAIPDNPAPPALSPFANEEVAHIDPIPGHFIRRGPHRLYVDRANVAPLDMFGFEVRDSTVFTRGPRRLEHLAQPNGVMPLDLCNTPMIRHLPQPFHARIAHPRIGLEFSDHDVTQ